MSFVYLHYASEVITDGLINEIKRKVGPEARLSLTLHHCKGSCEKVRTLFTFINEKVQLHSLHYVETQPFLPNETQLDLDNVFNELFLKDDSVKYHQSLVQLIVSGFERLALSHCCDAPNLTHVAIEDSVVTEPLTPARSIESLALNFLPDPIETMRQIHVSPKLRHVHFHGMKLTHATTEDIGRLIRYAEDIEFDKCDLQLLQFKTVLSGIERSHITVRQQGLPVGYRRLIVDYFRRNDQADPNNILLNSRTDMSVNRKLLQVRRRLRAGFVERVLQKVFPCEQLAQFTYSYLYCC